MTMTAVGCQRRLVSLPLGRHSVLLLLFIVFTLECCAFALDNEAENHQKPEKQPIPEENGLLVFSHVDDITKALDSVEHSMFLVLCVYSPSCRFCASLLSNLETAAQDLTTYFEIVGTEKNTLSPPLIGKLDATLMDAAMLQEQLDVTFFPSLVFLRGTRDSSILVEAYGSTETCTDIFQHILHYWYRWSFSAGENCVIARKNINEMNSFLHTHASEAIRHLEPALNPNLSQEERSHIEWLLTDESGEEDPFVFFVSCGKDLDEDFGEMSLILAAKRNVLFFQLDTCLGLLPTLVKDGTIVALLVSPPSDWTKWRDSIVKTIRKPKGETVEHFFVKMATPSVLWYERQSVAPIAFPTYRKIHAVLFVDVDEYSQSQTAIQLFRQSCRWSKLHQDEDMVCLIVPQTERRILLTFGIDLWTPLDTQATQGGPIKPVLPSLLITDQRFEGTRRYYLEARDILTSMTAIHEFVTKFWKDELTPAMQSSERAPRTSNSGVQVLTGASFRQAVLEQTEKHTLLYLFAPTCGHCKRFSILWNELARLFRHMGWDSLIDVAKMDVTSNEIVRTDFTLDVEEVPDVYFFPRSNKTRLIRYDIVDEFGDGAGRLSDSLEIIDWLLDVADEVDLDELLALLEESDSKNEADTKVLPKKEKKESDL